MLHIYRKVTLLFLTIGVVLVVWIALQNQRKSQADGQSMAFLSLNYVPVAMAGFDQIMDESSGSTSLTGLSSTDSDGDTLDYFWAELTDTADGCSLQDVTSAQPIVTVLDRLADYSCTFQLIVSDGKAESDPDSVQLTVRADNDPPAILTVPSVTLSEHTQWQTKLSAIDPEGENITWELRDFSRAFIEAGIRLDQLLITKQNQTVFAWQPSYDQAGTYPLQIVARDSANSPAKEGVMTVQPTNRPPVLASTIGNLMVNPTATSSLIDANNYFFDPDGDELSYTLSVTDSTVESNVTLSDGQLFLKNNPASQQMQLRISATDSAQELVTSNSIVVTLANWVPIWKSAMTITVIQTNTVGRFMAALQARRGHTLKIYNDTGQEVTRIKLNPGAIWWMVDTIVNQDDTVDIILAGRNKNKVYLRQVRWNAIDATIKLVDDVIVPYPITLQPNISRTDNTVRIEQVDGTVIFRWPIKI